MATPDHVREPCPDRILDDLGGAFSMGAVGGALYHFILGLKNSPKGERLHGGIQAVTLNAPRVGGSFAVWGGLFSTFDCGMVYLRQKEDPWNSIAAGAATGGFLQMRQGLRSATKSAIFGGILLALIEGAGILMNKMLAAPPPPPRIEEQGFPSMGFPNRPSLGNPQHGYQRSPPSSGSSPGLSSDMGSPSPATETKNEGSISGWFGKKKQKKEVPSSSENLDIFSSSAPPPVPNFEAK
eukprot:TRINITY_DN38498_c0_g1_i1.p1 TRINITY_DN38498_c0_g1~~TRINITY_DN38498_c0_g1_i1.p1  ORF type:complete len:239 (-),score=40.33 TRINITY_DN38498_c0_g1_i1:172-888(-)